MKTAIFTDDNGTTQLILTPQSDFDKSVIAKILLDKRYVQIMEGQFYKCCGGYERQGDQPSSLIFRFHGADG